MAAPLLAACGGDSRTVSVAAGETTTVSFDLACDAVLFDRIVFESDRDGGFELYVVDADGTGEGRLLDAPATEDRGATWGPARE